MESYEKLKQRQQKEFNDFKGLGFAFSEEQFKEMCTKLGIKREDAKDKLLSIGGGGFVLKTSEKALSDLMRKNEQELKEAMKNEDFVYQAFYYELANHEYIVTYSYTDTLQSLGIDYEELTNNEMYQEQLSKAVAQLEKDYKKMYEKEEVN